MDSTEGFTAQEIRGILWPIAQYKAKFGEPHMDIIEDLSFPSGKKRGVVLEDDGGPLYSGCINVFVATSKPHIGCFFYCKFLFFQWFYRQGNFRI
jgi:hypothetical protein